MCEVFSANKCLGCVGLEYDIDKVKKYCEIYREVTNEQYSNK